ncbi:MAG: CHAT domain-containing protein [Bacteroidetes bacterium]|nr:CHAT domain-containing protein [Bacteroidota bacterium]
MKTFIFSFLVCVPFFVFGQVVDTVDVIRQVDSLNKVSRTLTGQRDYDKALEVNAAAENLALGKLGRESAAYGNCCYIHGRVNYYKQDYFEAEKWYLEAKGIRERVVGKENTDFAKILTSLGVLYWSMGNYEKAETFYLEAKGIQEKVVGNKNTDYAKSLNNLALLYGDMGNYEKAEPLYLESKAIYEKVLGKEHPDYSQSLNNLANLYADMGNFEKAEPLYLESKAIYEKVLGKEHPEYTQCLGNLAILYQDMGNYEKAELLYFEAKSIYEKNLGKEHPEYASILNNLGILYFSMGNYEKAEPLYLEAKDIREKVLGMEHPKYAGSLNELGILYQEMGNYEKSEPLFLKAKAIYEKTLGKDHPRYANSLNNLGIFYWRLGNYEKAEPLYLEAKAIREKVLGMEHPDYGWSLNNLGLLYHDMGNYEKAETLYLEAIAIFEKNHGKQHPDYAVSLDNLALLYQDKGNYEKAETLYLESKAIYEKTLGKEHTAYVANLHKLASVYNKLSNFDKSVSLYAEAANLDQFLFTRALHHLSEQELNQYLLKFRENQDRIFSFAQLAPNPTRIISIFYNNNLFYKGFLLNSVNQIKRLALADSISTEKFHLLKSFDIRLAAEYVKPIAERQHLEELEGKANSIEKDLVRTVAGFGEAQQQVNWQEIQARLKPDETAVEFVSYNYYNPKFTDSTMYAALLLRPGDSSPHFIPLFEEKSLDSLLQTQGERRAEYVSNLYSLAERGAKPLGTPQKSLYELLCQPLEKELAGVQTIYFSPSGLLHRLNIGAIPINDEETIADRYRLVELGSTRQLVIPSEVKVTNQEALLFGGIKYEMDSTAISQANDDLTSETVASTRGELSFTYADSTLRGGTWSYLKWTDKEVTALEPILEAGGIQATTRRGYTATEEAFRTIGRDKPSPRILHIATHGFFFPDPKDRNEGRGTRDDEPIFKISDHPMIRSGLILAGGNHAWQTGKPIKPDMEDGILTAYEISQMNLSNTELVVLSACETGLGDIKGNEGVYGLQRAFKIAGAKYLIMSLWQVPDYQTQELMTTFYKRWLEDKMTIPDAFRSAQKEMREKYQDPYYWAGFVLVE